MDPITLKALQGAAGAAGDDKVYVEDVFSTTLYKGDASSNHHVVTGVDNTDECMIWIKERNSTNGNFLVDSLRYISGGGGSGQYTGYKGLSSNEDWPDTPASYNVPDVTELKTDGFVLKHQGGGYNASSGDYVAWNFKAAPGFFDVVTYTGDGVEGRNIAHSLGSVPGAMIVKNTDTTDAWRVYHRELTADETLRLSSTSAATTVTGANTYWNGTRPTASVFTVGMQGGVNESGKDYVAYIFAHDDQQFGEDEDESIIKCGQYTGTTAALDIDLGWEPQWFLVKRSDGGACNWLVFDNMRGVITGGEDVPLSPNLFSEEGGTGLSALDDTGGNNILAFTATGVAIRPAAILPVNVNGDEFIYIAIRRPHKKPEAGTEVFYSLARTGNDTETSITGVGFSPDAHFTKLRTLDGGSYMNPWFDKLRGAGADGSYLRPSEDAQEYTYLVSSLLLSFDQDGVTYGDGVYVNASSSSSGGDYINWMFKRAPGFFDVVAYTGDGTTSNNIPHSLGVKPEIVIVKNRDSNGTNWVFGAWIDDTLQVDMYLSDNVGSPIYSDGSVAPRWSTTTTFRVSGIGGVVIDNNTLNSNYIAYLFATLPGISKVGSYTGTGNDIDVDCGFTSGARFVMVKRSDSTGDWYLWDTERGIVGGDDPYLLLNSTAAEVTNTDYIDPLTTGFTITSSAPDALNVSGGTYIYLAIA